MCGGIWLCVLGGEGGVRGGGSGGLCALLICSRGVTNVLGRVATMFAEERIGVRDLGISTDDVGGVRGCAVAM